MSQPRDNEERKIPYDTLCVCGHIASDHWVSDREGNLFLSSCREGNLFLSSCRECSSSAYFVLNGLVCTDFKRDNLRYLENECKKKNI
jgi:hypothetical protein